MRRFLPFLVLCVLPGLAGCASDAFGPPRADMTENGPPGHPPGRPPHRLHGYEEAPPAPPFGSSSPNGPSELPGLATTTTSSHEVTPQFATPDTEVSYGQSQPQQ
ncbi:hypothetical protein KBA01_01460 [Kozakia baliensis]|nr:hypothetical protein KBA01_01460 [Kozakia baliensis]